MLVIPQEQMASDDWRPIDAGSAGSIELRIKRPTWDDLMADAETHYGFMPRRLKACILDWRGVDREDGQPFPFSWDNFQKLCVLYPALANNAAVAVSRLYLGLESDERKNSPAPAAAPSGVVTESLAQATNATIA